MDGAKRTPSSQGRKWLLLLLLTMEFSMLPSSVTSQNQAGGPAATAGLLCISDCATCPVTCSPPPPKVEPMLLPPPPPPLLVEPISPLPPPLVEAAPPPPESKPPRSPPIPHSPPQLKSPPAPVPPPPPLMPSISWGFGPPPPPGYITIPSGQGPPVGQRNYTYPYYYFASKAASLSLHSSFILVVFLAFGVVILDTKVGNWKGFKCF